MKQKFYALKNKNNEVRVNSSSGGFFYSLGEWVLQNHGTVYGAIYDENLNIVHKRIDKIEELPLMHGSKYSTSSLGNTFNEVKDDLNNKLMVLFSGTPCQIKALDLFLKDVNKDNLILVDMVCHGTPAKKYFDEYKKMMEKKYHSKIVKINMRYKDKKEFDKNKKEKQKYKNDEVISEHLMKLVFSNGKKYIRTSVLDPFYLNFDYFIRKGCFQCEFANLNRISDFTMGDFHQFNTKLGEFNDGNGVSLLIINTDKGYEIFNQMKEKYEVVEKTENEAYQPALASPATKLEKYDEFQSDYEKFGFEYVIKKYTPINFKFYIKSFMYKIDLYDKIKLMKRKIKRKEK